MISANRSRPAGIQRNAYLDLVYRKILPHTCPRSISKSHQVLVPLYLRPSSSFIMIRIQPTFRVKLIRVTSPQSLRAVDSNNGDTDPSAFGDEDSVDELARGGADGVSEWERVVDIDLRKWKMRRFKSHKLHTSLLSSATLGCFLNTSDVNASRYGREFTRWPSSFSPSALRSSARRVSCTSRLRASSRRAHFV